MKEKKKKRLKELKNVLTICLASSTLSMAGCLTSQSSIDWVEPQKPELVKVSFISIVDVSESDIKDGGFYIRVEDAKKLANNVDELKAYNEKLEVLIREMKKYYDAK